MKLRRMVVVSSQKPSYSPVLFPSPSASSLSTSAAQATSSPSTFSSGDSIVDSKRSPILPCVYAVSTCGDPYREGLGQGLRFAS